MIDSQQDLCVIKTNTTGQHIYFSFERFIATRDDDDDDIDLSLDLYLMFLMGSYTIINGTDTFQIEETSFYRLLSTSVNLMNCVSSKRTFNNNKRAHLHFEF